MGFCWVHELTFPFHLHPGWTSSADSKTVDPAKPPLTTSPFRQQNPVMPWDFPRILRSNLVFDDMSGIVTGSLATLSF